MRAAPPTRGPGGRPSFFSLALKGLSWFDRIWFGASIGVVGFVLWAAWQLLREGSSPPVILVGVALVLALWGFLARMVLSAAADRAAPVEDEGWNIPPPGQPGR